MIGASIIEEFWKPALVLLCGALLWIFVRIEQAHIDKLQAYNAQLTAQVTAANKEIDTQNAAVAALQAKGKEQQDRINALASAGTAQADKVVVQWKTKYVAQAVPADCSAAVAAGAVNAASAAQLYLNSTH